MTLQRVEVRTDSGALLQLPFQDISEGYAIQDIAGLDPVKATLVSSSFAQIDGAQFQSSKREARNLVFKISYEPDYVDSSIATLRKRLVSFFKTESRVSLRFVMAGGLSVDIVGIVESYDGPRFVQEVITTISVMCFNPDFVDPVPVVIPGLSTATSDEMVVDYVGSVESGFVFTLNVNRAINEFTIYHRPEDNVFRSMPFSYPLLAGDVVTISTVSGAKGATVLRGGTLRSVLYGISPFAPWINMFPGDNAIRVYAEGAPIPYSIKYTTKYGEI